MIDNVIKWSLRYRVIVIALALAFFGWGAYVLRDMPLDVLPDLSAPTVTIIVEGRGMVPTEMESLVTIPIESDVSKCPRLSFRDFHPEVHNLLVQYPPLDVYYPTHGL